MTASTQNVYLLAAKQLEIFVQQIEQRDYF